MSFLLDTHALLWWLNDDRRLGCQARDVIGDPDNVVLVSIVSLWEIAVKARIGKLRADILAIARIIDESFVRLDIGSAHLIALGGLPPLPDHRDPFDHLLIAQAIAEGAVFISEDRNTPRYAVRAMTCSDPPAPEPPR